ncbi:MAG TPA: hypothetical protein VHB51_03635 [Candidatus Saccharimonadales bacterium]|nr:hypothetical protein [Candidatus Saccharimonadales bacterium]
MWQNGYSSRVDVRPQPVSGELRHQVDNRAPITEIRHELFADIAGVAILQYRFGAAPTAPSNMREAGTSRLEYGLTLDRVRRHIDASRRARLHT